MKILTVCLGNICRSPLAQGLLEREIEAHDLDWSVDSAGTSEWNIGQPPDPRSIAIAREHGMEISLQRARKVRKKDLSDFDLILAMDQSNYRYLRELDTDNLYVDKIKLIMNFVNPGQNQAVPDPYYDGSFDLVYRMLDRAAKNIVEQFS